MTKKPFIYTKPTLISKLKEISAMGFVPNARKGNAGGIGNTLEDLLEIKENNLPIPNAAEWELKTKRLNTTSLITLFHTEPSPRAIRFVPQMLLPLYGWPHEEAGKKYSKNEVSFRQTIPGKLGTDRGFKVVVDRKKQKVLISFDVNNVSARHKKWLGTVKKRVGIGELNPQPYWGFDDLEHKAGTKLLNTFYVQAAVKKVRGKEYYHYTKVMMLQKFSFDKFLGALEEGKILPDFDARTGHNHGTKFRMRPDCLPMLYEKVTTVI
ncbi:MAG: MvaI/BcnI family restriction endonuclease [Candidatus Vogelbacteria bacterium]